MKYSHFVQNTQPFINPPAKSLQIEQVDDSVRMRVSLWFSRTLNISTEENSFQLKLSRYSKNH